MKIIYLTGFMGTGKTTIGSLLAKELGWNFIDIDRYIEQQSAMTVGEIFEKYGEDEFRKLETLALQEVTSAQPVVVGCGGGVVLKAENRDILINNGTTILLTAEPSTVAQRVGKDNTRPLLSGKIEIERIEKMISQRLPLYNKTKDAEVATDGKSPSEIVKDIIKELNLCEDVTS